MLNFNENGYLEPFGEIATTIEIVKEYFVWNEQRNELFNSFETFIIELQTIIQQPFTVWLDGSFTTKKEFPNDIDCVIFVDYRCFDGKETAFFNLKMVYKKLKIDSYSVKVYPEQHEKYVIFTNDKQDWERIFGRTRLNTHTGLYYSKGFLQLKM